MTEQLAQAPEVTFRQATEADSAAVARSFLAASQSSYTDTAKHKGFDGGWVETEMQALASKYGETYWRDLIAQAQASQGEQLFVISEDPAHHINGLMHAKRGANSVFLNALYLRPEVQGQGIGGQFLEQAEAFADGLPLELDVMEANKLAISFYEKHGFRQSSEVFKHKPDTPLVFLMKKDPGEAQ